MEGRESPSGASQGAPEEAPGTPRGATGGGRLLTTLTSLFGLLAGLATLIYVGGASIMALRLWFADLPNPTAVASRLSREVLISLGLTWIVAPAVVVFLGYVAWRFAMSLKSFDEGRTLDERWLDTGETWGLRVQSRGSLADGDGGGLLAAFLNVRLDELLGVLLEDGVDLVEEVVQFALEVRRVHSALYRLVLDGTGPGPVMSLGLFVNPFHVRRPLLRHIGSVRGRVHSTR
jgi:hypothetical protein